MYKLRLKILLGIFALIFVLIVGRLVHMQLIDGEEYRQRAKQTLSKVKFIPGQRGRILDRNGVILATDEACHDFHLDYRFIVGDDIWRKRQIRNLAQREGISQEEAATRFSQAENFTWQIAGSLAREQGEDINDNVQRLCRSISRMREHVGRDIVEMRRSHAVVSGLTEAQVNALRPLMQKMVGAKLEPSHRRLYPYRDTACHIIGTTRRVFAEDVREHNMAEQDADWLTRMRRNYTPSDTIGGSGVEKAAEQQLRFVRGYRRFSRPGVVSKLVSATNGQDVKLTIDIDLQRALTKLMKKSGHTGSIVIIDVRTGDVLAMVSWPTYDLNRFRRDYNRLLKDTINLPLNHRAVAAAYAPGSTIKPFTGLIGCALGKISPGTMLECTGKNPFARNGKPRCHIYKTHHITHGELDLPTAIKRSCNIFFVRVADRVGPDALSAWLRMFGFGEYPNTSLPEERRGILADEGYLQQYKNRGFYRSDAWFMCMGQGVFAATPLQLAAAMATIASRGDYRSPVVIDSMRNKQKHVKLNIPSSAFDAVFDGMYRVVNERRGTAYTPWRTTGDPLDITVCGKTGTATVPAMRIDSNGDGRITTADRVVKIGDMCWFAGFAPKHDPQVAFAVLVEYSQGSGGTDAGPIAKEALRLCKKFGYLK